ncbi:MAG: S8 family serine peptidase [Methylacidiphilales bacterium]|nr:S8 family serine peptidase [Candidatus Methylacidiphilales bacterium]
MADMGSQDFLKNAQRLAYRDDLPNAAGEFRRVSLYRTDMKYPLVRVEETRIQEPNGNSVLLAQDAAVADHVVVELQPGATVADVSQIAAQNGATVLKPMHTPGFYLLQLPNPNLDSLPLAIQTFGKSAKVLKYVEADSILHATLVPNDPNFSGEWGLNNTGQTSGKPHADIDATDAWGIINSSPNVVVAVLDTGIDFNHPDLAANIWTNPNPGSDPGYINDTHGWNFYADNNNPQDDHFHGTHVSGTIGALGNNGQGVAGVTWHVKIMPLKFLSSNGSGYTSDAVDGINYATYMGAKIISNSWGGGAYSQALKNAIDAANTAGVLFVVAAGNNGANTDLTPSYPSCYASPNILSVAATDANDQLASFSNYGTKTVALAAPGVGVLSTFPTVATAAMSSYGLPTSYGQISGTSMATPHVSGAAALALAENPSLTVAQLKSLLIQRTDQLSQLAGLIQTSGRLNLYNVVNLNWQPKTAQLQMSSISLNDSEGNNDGYANPGELIRLIPTLLNVGGQAAGNVTVQIVSNQATATVLTSTVTVGSLQPYQPYVVGTPFRIQLSGALQDNAVLTFDVVIRATGLPDVHAPATVVVSKPKGFVEATVNFSCGEMKADTARNLVYVIDRTDHRVLEIDTALGQLTAYASLDDGAVGGNSPSVTGQLAVSLDGTRLYVALTAAQKIQVFSLPDLSPLVSLPLDFSPYGLACGVNGRLYASSTDYWGKIREVNTSNGLDIQSFDKGGNQQFYKQALLRTSQYGTNLYVGETGLYTVGGPGYIYQYNISGGTASLLQTFPFVQVYLNDFAVDEQQNRMYTLNGGIYGVEVTDMLTGDYGNVYPFGSAYGEAVAFLPNDSVIYGASGDPYSGNIRKFNRADGTTLGDYVVGTNGKPVSPRGIAITPNGNILYIKAGSGGGSILGLIGGNSLAINNPPPPPTGSAINLSTVAFSDVEGNGDSVPNSGEIVSLTPTLLNTGGQSATNVSISLAAGTGASLLSPSSQTLGTVAAGASSVAGAYRIQLASGLADGTAITFTFTANWDTGQSKQFIYAIVVRATPSRGELASTLQFGEILADQQRNIVYVVDKRYLRVLLFDTDAGHINSAVPIGGLATVNGAPPAPGMMAESVDGSRLYLALPQSQIIQVFSLPDMTSLAQWSYSFQPESLACDALGRIYCTTNDATQKLVQINATTGAVLSQTGPGFVVSGILRRNAAGTELYGSLSNQIYRFSTAGAGAPTQLSILTAGSSSLYIRDFAVDEQADVFYAILSDGKLTLVPLNGGSVTSWNLNQSWGSAVSYVPGRSDVLGASDYWYGGGIRRFSRANGSTLQDYVITNNADSITYRGLATTQNGRTVYVKARWDGSSTANTVDGYDYSLGMIGGAVDLDVPPGVPIGLKGVVVTDPAPGSADGYVHPGQTVQLSPTFKNFSNFQISNVSVDLLCSDPLATLQTPMTDVVGNVSSYVSFTPSPNFKVAISPSATDGHEIKLTFRVNYNNGTQQLISYSLFVAASLTAETQVNFQIGSVIADRTRDLAYVVDNTNLRLLAIDTDAGVTSKTAKLVAAPGSGGMAISPDGTQLYIALTGARQVQVFQLPGLTQSDIINLNFQPVSLAVASDGRLYASSTAGWGYLYQIDPATGQTLGQFGQRTYYSGPTIKTNGDSSSLFVVELGLSGSSSVDQYIVSSSSVPNFTHAYPFVLENTIDIAIDDDYARIYSASGGVYGVGVTEMNTGVGNIVWPYGQPYSSAVCFLQGSNFVYGAAPYNLIRRFNRANGAPLADFPVVNSQIMNRGVVITANGHLLYVKSTSLGLIGNSSLNINSTSAAPTIYLGGDQTIRLSQAATLSASVTGSSSSLPIAWKMLNGPQKATFSSVNSVSSSGINPSVSFSAPGTYRVSGTVTDGSLTGSDAINITVLPDPPAVSVTATNPVAINNVANGQLTFTRTGASAGSLAVSYAVAGTAHSGVDYVALLGTATIPDGAASITIPVVANAGAAPNSTVVATVASSANYQLGVSQQASVTIANLSFNNWAAATLANYSTGQQAATVSPAGDGISNLMKYALGLNPLLYYSPGSPAMPATQLQSFSSANYLTLSYTQLQNASDIHYIVQVSSDLVNWHSGPTYTTQVSSTPNGDSTATVVVRDLTPVSSAAARFIRLQVTQP